jgi:hypothetical protein
MMGALLWAAVGSAGVLGLGYAKQRLWSFAAQRPQDYADGRPQFDMRTHLNGPITCEGVIYGPLGRVTSRFIGDFEAKWDGNVGVMKERFEYDSGTVQDREWHLRIGNDGRIQATAADVVGTGTGAQMGSAVVLKYRVRLPQDAGGHVLDATDWMYLTANGTIVNRSQFRKFGVKVAELVATMRPKDFA